MCKKKKAEPKSVRQYKRKMRKMILDIHSESFTVAKDASIEDLKILSDCIRFGYINGSLDQADGALRTLDGKIYPRVYNKEITLKGLEFLYPPADWQFLIPTLISVLALGLSVLSLLTDLAVLLLPSY